MSTSDAEKIAKVFTDYCKSKGYQVQQSVEKINLRLDISNFKDRTTVSIYYSQTIVIRGPENELKKELEEFKSKFDANPGSFLTEEKIKIRSCSTKYDIMLPGLRKEVKQSLDKLGAELNLTENPDQVTEYRAKVTTNSYSLTLTQFSNGTLLLQGKNDELFDRCCDLIEKIANPSDKDVISRFISSDEETLKVFTARYTPGLLIIAEDNVKKKLGIVYEYLEPHDKKWFVASECLYLSKIPLPEYSPIVMPASKAFEGFVKKLLVGIGLYEVDYFKIKTATFYLLTDKDNPRRKAICAKEKYADTMLKKISLCLDTNRNFMMHSDDSMVTKIDSQTEAEEKVNSICKDTKEIFDYFNNIYTLLPV